MELFEKFPEVSQAWSKDFNELRVSQTLEAVKGEWGTQTKEGVHVAKVGKIVFWQRLGAGSESFPVPKATYRYYARVVTDNGYMQSLFVEAGKEQLTVSAPTDTRWQAEGTFIMEV